MAFANLIVKISGDITSLDASTRKAVERVKALGANLQSVGSSLALGISAPLAGIAGVALKAAGDLEALKLGLVSVAGGAKQAEVQFAQLREVAKLPGLGLKEAVQGSINLQALGFSADKSRNILLQFGNAIATVGRGREDLGEVIRQLGQLGARGQVTADNLKPIIERVPQVAAIIREKFGAEALGDPAKTFAKLGISSQRLIEILEEELGKAPRIASGFKNQMENFRESTELAFAKAGAAMIPFAKAFLEDFAVPAISKIADLASAFGALPTPIQGVGFGLGAIAAVGPLVVLAIGSMISNLALITETLTKLGGVAVLTTQALNAIPWVAAAAAVLYLGNATYKLYDAKKQIILAEQAQEFAINKTIEALKKKGIAVDESRRFETVSAYTKDPRTGLMRPNDNFTTGQKTTKAFREELQRLVAANAAVGESASKAAKPVSAFNATVSSGIEKVGKTAEGLARLSSGLKNNTIESQILHRQQQILNQQHDEWIDRMAKARLGLSTLFDGMPQFSEAAVNIRKLGDEFGYVRQAAEQAALSIKSASIDLGKFDTSPSKQRQADMGRVAKENQKQYEEQLKAGAREAKKFERQVSLIANDLARNITDLIFKGGKLKDVLASTFSELGKSLVRSALETQFKRIVGLVTDLALKLPGVGKAIGGIFGVGGGVASAAGGVASTAGSVVGAAGSAAGGIAGTVGGIGGSLASAGTTALVGAVAGVVSAVSGVISNFQFAAMNKSLDLIEKETRYSQIHLGYILEKINLHLPVLNNIHDRLATMVTQGIGVYNATSDAGLRLQGGGSGGVTIHINNPTFGAGTTQAGITAMLQEAARQAALAGATA